MILFLENDRCKMLMWRKHNEDCIHMCNMEQFSSEFCTKILIPPFGFQKVGFLNCTAINKDKHLETGEWNLKYS